MEKLNYSLTWKTTCFLSSSCNETVYAHTNGDGDFVLFDELRYPWPIHRYYEDRFKGHVGRSSNFDFGSSAAQDWDEVTTISPEPDGPRKRFGFVATVTNIEKGFLNKSEEFRTLHSAANKEVKQTLSGATSYITMTTGDGAEYSAFVDLKKFPANFRDIIVCDLKAIYLFNKPVFLVTNIQSFYKSNRH